ncbi:universal stress protein [Peterkaempfera griseoplana]|uniref:universal stress protein n=1 Tax=Peterkaempfera griseoplana TaxID=66896 RepID=UPI0007C655EB|nr:universal stress protein [Peterkaempfera griseoplana]
MQSVVAAVDGSQSSRRALEWAADEAERRGSALKLVYASLWERYECDEEEKEENDDFARGRDAARRMLAGEAARARRRCPGLEVTTEVIPGETVPALLHAGREAGLLVLGSRGHGGFQNLLLGSVSLGVAARADFPVVVVHATEPAPARGKVVLGSGTHQPGPAADFAREQAARRKAELEVVHAWEPQVDMSGFSVTLDTGSAQEQARSLVAVVTAALEQPGPDVKVHGQVPAGSAAAALVRASADADLLVVGSRKRHGHLGPVTHAVLHHAACPVALIPTSA